MAVSNSSAFGALHALTQTYPNVMRNVVSARGMDGFYVGLTGRILILRYSDDTETTIRYDDMQMLRAKLAELEAELRPHAVPRLTSRAAWQLHRRGDINFDSKTSF